MTEINEQLTRYLLGDISEEEEVQIELSLFKDDAYEELQLAEDDLVTNYVRNKLTSRELELFEKNYLSASPERIQKLLFTKSIVSQTRKEASLEMQPSTQITAERSRRLTWSSVFLPKYVYSFLVGIVAGVLIFALIQKIDFGSSGLVTTGTEKLKQLESELKVERVKTEQLQKENQILKQRQEQLTQEMTEIKKIPQSSGKNLREVAVNSPKPNLTPSVSQQKTPIPEVYPTSETTLGGGEPEEFPVDKQSSAIEVNLLIEKPSYKKFRVRLESAPPFVTTVNKTVNTKRGLAVRIILTTKLLNDGNNEIRLFEIDNKGQSNEIQSYILRVRKK